MIVYSDLQPQFIIVEWIGHSSGGGKSVAKQLYELLVQPATRVRKCQHLARLGLNFVYKCETSVPPLSAAGRQRLVVNSADVKTD